ncbi:MAG: DUF305 domain-containing protein [Ginsengibacter sp.]
MKFYIPGSLFIIVFFLFTNEIIAQKNQTEQKDHDNLSAKNFYMQCMENMMDSMHKQSSILSPDIDFLSQMIAHHKGAVEMAKYEIVHGNNSEMIQLAKSILYEQSSEVNMMNLWLKIPLPKSSIPDNYKAAMSASMNRMMVDMMIDTINAEEDRIFATIMIPHHNAAIDMARVMLEYSSNNQIVAFSKQLISNEQIEVEQMLAFIKK